MQSNTILTVLSNDEANRFMEEYGDADIPTLSLKFAGKTSFHLGTTLELMAIYRKAKKKAPIISSFHLAVDKRAYEQSTSEQVAKHKATFISGNLLLDITAGIGIDSIFLASNFKNIVAIEQNKNLHEWACYNFKKLGITNISRIHGNALDYISTKKVDWIYIDPDRRSHQRRSITLEYMEPNVLEIMPLLKTVTDKIYLKLSPLFDIAEIIRNFKNVEAIHLISEKNEMKEVGVILNWLHHTDPHIFLKDVGGSFMSDFPFEIYLNQKKYTDYYGYGDFIHVPLATVSKSSCYHFFTQSQKILKHTIYPLFFSNQSYLDGFKTYKIIEQWGYSVKKVKEFLTSNDYQKLNIILKGTSEIPIKYHKKLGTTDGGDVYLFILKLRKKSEMILSRLIS